MSSASASPAAVTCPLHEAVHRNNVQEIRTLIANVGNVNEKDSNGDTPLHKAAICGHLKVLQVLLGQNGIDVNAKNKFCQTPLHMSTKNGYLDATALLVEKGANVNEVDDKRCTPLHNAARFGHDRLADLLIKKGGKLDTPDVFGFTPLFLAARNDHLDVLRVLVDSGADVNWRQSAMSWTAFHSVCARRNPNVGVAKELLLNGVDESLTDTHGKTALDIAECTAIIELLTSPFTPPSRNLMHVLAAFRTPPDADEASEEGPGCGASEKQAPLSRVANNEDATWLCDVWLQRIR